MGIRDEIQNSVSIFQDLCSDHKVKYLYAFGSSTTDNFDPLKSDIDLLVEIEDSEPIERGEKLINLRVSV